MQAELLARRPWVLIPISTNYRNGAKIAPLSTRSKACIPARIKNNMLVRGLIIGSVGALTLSMTGSATADLPRPHAHLTGTDCGGCHVDLVLASRLTAPQEKLCVACHDTAMQFSHPTGFAPGRSLPAEYPLDLRGFLTCSTCHQPHGVQPSLLRGVKYSRDFCLACHDEAFVSSMKDQGTSLSASGHLDIAGGRGTADLDSQSLYCLGCHVGGHTGTIGISMASRGGIRRPSNPGGPHPVGGSYDDASRRTGGFLPEYLLAQRNIRLPDGKLSCVSCHQAYTKDHGKLTVTMERSALCLSCHAK